MSPIDQLPEDTIALKQIVVELFNRLQKSEGKVEELTHQMQTLLRSRYGRKAETFVDEQLRLFEEVEASPGSEPFEKLEQEQQVRDRKKHGRGKPSGELPRKRIVYELSPGKLPCPDCGKEKKRIGEETSEQHDYVPASICVIEHVKCKYACAECAGQVIIAEGPNKPIERGLATAGMLAYIATCKYADHLPLNRLEGIFKRQGAKIARSTMCD